MINNRNIVKGRISLLSDLYSPSVDVVKYYEMCESFSKYFSNDEFKASFDTRLEEESCFNDREYNGFIRMISFTAYKNDPNKSFHDYMKELMNTGEYKGYIRDIFSKGNDYYPHMIQMEYDEIIGDNICISNRFFVDYKHYMDSSIEQYYEGRKFDYKTTSLKELSDALFVYRCSYDPVFLLGTFSKGENYAER